MTSICNVFILFPVLCLIAVVDLANNSHVISELEHQISFVFCHTVLGVFEQSKGLNTQTYGAHVLRIRVEEMLGPIPAD